MRTRSRSAIGSVLLLVILYPLIGSAQFLATTQDPPGILTVTASTISELRTWDRTVDQMIRSRELVVRDVRGDPVLQGRRHETLVQYYQDTGGIQDTNRRVERRRALGRRRDWRSP